MQPRGRLLASGVRRAGESLYAAAVRLAREETDLVDVRPCAVDLAAQPAVFGLEPPTGRTPQHADPSEVGVPATGAGPPTPADPSEVGVPATGAGPPTPADPSEVGVPATSSGPPARNLELREITAGPVIGFRAMTRADFHDVVRWVNEPHVARWWDDEGSTVERAERHYGPALDGTDGTRMWVVEVNGRSVGFVQDYRIGDHPDWALLTALPDAVGFDYVIGEPAWVGRGVGTRMLWSFLRDVVRPHYPEAATYFAAPDHRNVASLRVLDKLGFVRGLWFDEPGRDGSVSTVVGCSLDVPSILG